MGGLFSKEERQASKLARALRSNYQELEIQNLKWMTRRPNFMTKDFFVQFLLDDSNNAVPLESIFEPIGALKPLRILIVTQHDYEKKLFAYKFIHDWAWREDYLDKFQFAFLVSLKDLNGRTIQNEIRTIAVRFGYRVKGKRFEKLIKHYAAKTLFVLHGLDELGSASKKDVNAVLYRKKYRNVTIVTTCRRDIFKARTKSGWVFNDVTKNLDFSDRKITILSLDDDNRNRFIDKLIMVKNKERLKVRIVDVIKQFEDVFVECPLYFVLLIYVILSCEEATIKTKTDLFKQFVNQIVRLTIKAVDTNFDLFREDDVMDNYRNAFYKFGQICVEKIMALENNNCLTFECDDLTDEIYNAGFLILNDGKIVRRIPPESMIAAKIVRGDDVFYEGFYLSIYEFIAAFSLWEEWKRNSNKFPQKTINVINEMFVKCGGKPMFMAFVCGLMNDNANELFVQLSSYAPLYSTNEKGTILVLEQCPTNDTSAIFIPPEIFVNGALTLRLRELVKTGFANGRIYKLNVTTEQIRNLPRCFKQTILRVNIQTDFPEKHRNILREPPDCIKCKRIIFVFLANLKADLDSLKKYILLYNSIGAKSRAWYWYEPDMYPILLQCINNGDLKDCVIEELTFVLTRDVCGKDAVEYIISNNKLRQLTVIIEKNAVLNDIKMIITAATISQDLDALRIYNFSDDEVHIDYQEITSNETKQWRKLWLYSLVLECRTPFSQPTKICSYYVEKCKFKGKLFDVLSAVTPGHFGCNYNILNLMVKGLNSVMWGGWQMIEELLLIFTPADPAFSCDNFATLLSMDNLDRIKIDIRKKLLLNEQFDIVACLKVLGVAHFRMEWEMEFFQSAFNVLEILKKSIKRGEMPKLMSIKIFISDSKNDKSNLKALVGVLLQCLQIDNPKTVSIVATLAIDLYVLLRENVVDFNVYSVEHIVQDSTLKMSYYEYKFDIRHVLNISLK